MSIASMSASRSFPPNAIQQESSTWDATVTLKNFGTQPQQIRLETRYAGTAVRTAPDLACAASGNGRRISLHQCLRRRTGGEHCAGRCSADRPRVRLRLPRSGPLQITVYTSRAAEWRPLLEVESPLGRAFFESVAIPIRQRAAKWLCSINLFHARKPTLPVLWIDPPREGSPIAVKGIDFDSVIKTWHNETVLGAGLHAKEAHIDNAEIFDAFEGDIPVASVAGGPIVVARRRRRNQPRFGIIGFDPLQGELEV